MRVLLLGIGLTTALYGQYMLTSGVQSGLFYTGNALQNGKNGFAIPITGDPSLLTVTMQITPAWAGMNVYVRCGTDVAQQGNTFLADTSAQVFGNSPLTLTVSRPNGARQETAISHRTSSRADMLAARLPLPFRRFPAEEPKSPCPASVPFI